MCIVEAIYVVCMFHGVRILTLYEKDSFCIMDEKMDEMDNMDDMNIWTIWTWTLKKFRDIKNTMLNVGGA
jgi:hypothetical protein